MEFDNHNKFEDYHEFLQLVFIIQKPKKKLNLSKNQILEKISMINFTFHFYRHLINQ